MQTNIGVDWGKIGSQAIDGAALQAAAVQMIAQSSEADALDVVCSLIEALEGSDAVGDGMLYQLQSISANDLVQSGQALDNDANTLIENYDPDAGDPSVPGKAAQLQTRMNSWQNQAWSALRTAEQSGQLGTGAPAASTPGQTTVTDNPLTAYATTVNVVSTAGYPAAPNVIQIDGEQIYYTAMSPTAFLGCQRGFDPSSLYGGTPGMSFVAPAAQHNKGATVLVSTVSAGGAGAFDPGVGGGGYGGGSYGGDEGGSDPFDDMPEDEGDYYSKLQAFREGGVDPFDDSGEPSPGDGVTPDDAFADDGESANGATDEGVSNGGVDPFADQSAAPAMDGGDLFMDALNADLNPESDASQTSDSSDDSLDSTDGASSDEDKLRSGGLVAQADTTDVLGAGEWTPEAHRRRMAFLKGSKEEVLGFDWSSEWGQIFYNPAGIAMDALNQPKAVQFMRPKGKVGAVVVKQQPSPAVAQQLAQSKLRLAAVTAQLAQLHGTTPPQPVAATIASVQQQLQQQMAQQYQYPAAPLPTAPAASTDYSSDDGSYDDTSSDGGDDTVMGDDDLIPMHEADDIVIDRWNRDITDEEPDYERGRASAHRGSSYLEQDAYVPGGVSAGREGGLMEPQQKIEVFGGEDGTYGHGLDVLGAAVRGNIQPIKAIASRVGSALTGKKPPAPPRAGFVQKTAPNGRKFTSLVVNHIKAHKHSASIKNAQDAGKRAVSLGKKLQAAIKKNAKTLDHVVKAVAAKTSVKGEEILGAVPKKRLVKHVLTTAQLQKLAKGAIDAGNKATKGASTHKSLVKSLNAKIQAGATNAAKKLHTGSKVGGKTMIQGEGVNLDHVNDVLAAHVSSISILDDNSVDQETRDGDDVEIGGEEILGATDPMTGDQIDPVTGYPIDPSTGMPYDPATGLPIGGAAGGYGGVDPTTGYPIDPATGLPIDPTTGLPMDGEAAIASGPPDYGMGPPPTRDQATPVAGQDFLPDPFPGGEGDMTPYSSAPVAGMPTQDLPLGAVVYDGSVAPPYLGLGSYSFYFGQAGGQTAGGAGPAKPAGGDYASGGSGYQWHDDGWYSFRKNDYAGPAGSGDQRLKKAEDSSDATGQARAMNSYNYNWGPMMGDPNGPMRGLRYDVGGNQWFWYFDQAPDWAKSPIVNALYQQKILDYQAQVAAAAADAAAQAAQDKLDAENAAALAKQQAAEDAQMARQQQQEYQQAQSDSQIQQLADQAAFQQEQDQAQIDQQAALTQAQIDKQAMDEQAAIESRAAETAARIQAMQDQSDAQLLAQMQAQGGGGGQGGGDGGYADDGSDLDQGEPVDDSAAFDSDL